MFNEKVNLSETSGRVTLKEIRGPRGWVQGKKEKDIGSKNRERNCEEELARGRKGVRERVCERKRWGM